MKRTIFLSSLLLFIAPFAYASTQVPDTLSGDVDWDSSQSPYIIQGKVEVPAGSVLHIGPGVHVVYQGVGELSVKGVLEVAGSAAAPVVFDMTQAGLQSQFVLTGAQADISDAKFLGGVFLARDSQLSVQESEFTKGSGVYLQGKTEAVLKSNKIYGNATGAVLDGPSLKATFLFNTFVQNTYGLYLKNYLYLKFSNNSIHDNNEQVINATHGTAQLGGNYWGSLDAGALHLKTQGGADFSPLKDLKDVLRVYIMTQLPDITLAQSNALAAKERKQEKMDALALKKWDKEQAMEAKAAAVAQAKAASALASSAASAPAPAPAQETLTTSPAPPAVTVVPEEAASSPAPAEETAAPSGPAGVAVVKSLTSAPHTLPPAANLPPEQDLNLEGAASNPTVEESPSTAPVETSPAPAVAVETSPASAPAPPPLTTTTDQTMPPPPDMTAPPASVTVPSDDNSIPPPPVGLDSGDAASSAQPPAPASSNAPPPPSLDSATIQPPPPNPTDLDSVPPPASSNPANGMEEVPPVPGSAVPSTGTNSSSAPSADNAPPPPPPPAVTAPVAPAVAPVTTGRVSASGSTSDEIEAPSADLSGVAPPASTSSSSGAVSSNAAPVTSTTDLALPPIQDLDVPPPKDLDLPPTGDLGNVDLDNNKK